MVLDLPDPLGPTMAENDCDDSWLASVGESYWQRLTLWNGPMTCLPA